MPDISKRHLCKNYGIRYKSKAMATARTLGMTLSELEFELYQLGAPTKTVLQWAINNADYLAFK